MGAPEQTCRAREARARLAARRPPRRSSETVHKRPIEIFVATVATVATGATGATVATAAAVVTSDRPPFTPSAKDAPITGT